MLIQTQKEDRSIAVYKRYLRRIAKSGGESIRIAGLCVVVNN